MLNPRKYSAAEKAKRDKKFRAQLARKQNPVRFVLALPEDIKLNDIDWRADHFEELASQLAEMRARWTKEDDARRKKRLAEILVAVKQDGLL